MRPKRVLLLTHYYYPELGAPQTRLGETARLLVEMGHEVRVLTGPPHYPNGHVRQGYSPVRLHRELVDGVSVTRLPMWPRPNRGALDRTIDQASFAAVAGAALYPARWSDVVLVESPPLFLGLTATWYRLVARRPYVFHVADPWPDFPIAMGALRQPVLQALARRVESSAYRHASLITTVTPGLVDLLERNPAAAGKVRLLPNGVDVSKFGSPTDVAVVRASLGWSEGRFVIVYLGSVGLAQGVGTLLDALEMHPGSNIEVHVIGEGFERSALEQSARRRGIVGVTFHSGIPATDAPRVLAAADAVLVMLRKGALYDHALPTKLVEGLAAGKPVIVSAGGEAARLVADSGAGFTAPPEDPVALRDAIAACAAAIDLPSRGAAGRQLAEASFDRRMIIRQLARYLDEAATDRAST
jgi:glycosyltransferase involved in cell wall biosynthesis